MGGEWALLLVLNVTGRVISFIICESIFATFIFDSMWNISLQVYELNVVLHLKSFVSHKWKEIFCSYHDICMGQNMDWQMVAEIYYLIVVSVDHCKYTIVSNRVYERNCRKGVMDDKCLLIMTIVVDKYSNLIQYFSIYNI